MTLGFGVLRENKTNKNEYKVVKEFRNLGIVKKGL